MKLSPEECSLYDESPHRNPRRQRRGGLRANGRRLAAFAVAHDFRTEVHFSYAITIRSGSDRNLRVIRVHIPAHRSRRPSQWVHAYHAKSIIRTTKSPDQLPAASAPGVWVRTAKIVGHVGPDATINQSHILRRYAYTKRLTSWLLDNLSPSGETWKIHATPNHLIILRLGQAVQQDKLKARTNSL
jgi:hypothetical protein